ncbi:MAG: hypothetical protein ACRD1P_04010 [Thermoanaerobaculia bacterium]
MSRDWWVLYRVLGQDLRAGPYTLAEAEIHKADIESFEGVTDVKLVQK